MSRSLAIMLLLLLPLAAAAQAVGNQQAGAAPWVLAQQPGMATDVAPGTVLPLWRGADGRLLVFKLSHSATNTAAAQARAPLSFQAVDAATLDAAGLQYGLAPNLHAQAELTQRTLINQPLRLLGTEVGASYDFGRYMVGLSVGANSAAERNDALPRVLPGVAPGVNGLSSFDSDMHVRAQGRLALGDQTGIDLGASTGRIQLLPGNLLGVSTLDQRTLSFGVDHGPLSGSLIERTMQPQAGIPGGFNASRRWSSVDLGVTWRLPWRGELSVGAQNLWSSGPAANTPVGPQPDQSRTPYVQYHQDLNP